MSFEMIRMIAVPIKLSAICMQFLLVSTLLSGCGDTVNSPDDSSSVVVTLQGQIIDSVTKEAIVGAKIEIGSWSAVTGDGGFYKIDNVVANSGGGVSYNYRAIVTLSEVTEPVDMTNVDITPRYPDRKLVGPISGGSTASTIHNFEIGKLSASIQGWTGDKNRVALGGVSVELHDNTEGSEGVVIQTVVSDEVTGEFKFINIEAGVEYNLVAKTEDGSLQGSVVIGKPGDNEQLVAALGGDHELILSTDDVYSPRIIAVSPEHNSDVLPGTLNVVFTFNEPIFQDAYSTPNPLAISGNIYNDIDVSYGGFKASGNFAHTLSWNENFDQLTVEIPNTGVSSKYTVDLSLLSPTGEGDNRVLGKLTDLSGNKLEDSPVLENGNLLAFTTNGGVLAESPIILSPNAASMDSGSTSVTIDWLPAVGATKGYNIYRSTRSYLNTGVEEPFIKIADGVAESKFVDTQADTGFSLLVNNEIAQFFIYRVTSVNSDYIESLPSNKLVIKDVIPPALASGSASNCVPPGGTSLNTATPNVIVENGQIEITFSEALDAASAETLTNYTGSNLLAITLNSPTSVLVDFSVPIVCSNTESLIVGTGVQDIVGNGMSGATSERTISYVP
jgi:hypothetical protein